MNKLNFKQVFGAVAIMFAILFLLIMASNIQLVGRSATSFFHGIDTQLAKPLSPASEQQNPPAPDNIATGIFNNDTTGNVIYRDKDTPNTNFHYKAIRSDKLRTVGENKPKLMLEVKKDGFSVWENIAWSWIDSEQGILYFHYLTEKNGIQEKTHDFTGRYQLIF